MRLWHVFSSLLVVMLAWQPAMPTHAQLSCENPPINVSNLTPVWDLTDFCIFQDGVFDEILSGGVPRDGIPPIDNPTFESIADADAWLAPQSPVLALELDGEARAYPLAILTRHEIVNDTVGDVPLAVTFCPLCNSAIVFDRRVDDEVLRFGVSGLLRYSDLIMWDDKTQSWWQQFTGEGIVGTYTGRMLDIYPSLLISFGVFSQRYPDGVVLTRESSGYGEAGYGRNPYANYDSSSRPFLFNQPLDERLFATARVLGYFTGEKAIAYPFEVLSETPVINDNLDGQALVAFWQAGAASALGASIIDEAQDVGMAALYDATLDGQTLTFALDEGGAIVDEQTGSTWNFFGEAVAGELEGERLRQLQAFPHFWFAWAAFRPDTAIYAPQ